LVNSDSQAVITLAGAMSLADRKYQTVQNYVSLVEIVQIDVRKAIESVFTANNLF
jgi:hypothetical protein